MRARTQLARALGRLAGTASRTLGRGSATSLPGVVGLKLQPELIKELRRGLSPVVAVTGTNGKTTTSRFIGQMLEAHGMPYVHNQAGSNLVRGIATSLLQARLPRGEHRPAGLFEVDEATMPAACAQLQPDVVVVTNLFRDQLDRYGELGRTARYLQDGLATLPATSTVVLNADDPLVATLGHGLPCRVVYYGIDDTSVARAALPHAADSVIDPATGDLLDYSAVFLGHLGHYRSPSGRMARPQPDVALTSVSLDGIEGSDLVMAAPGHQLKIRLGLPGLYNAYNALAAAAVGTALSLEPSRITAAIAETAAAFGRVERITVGNKSLWLGLIKNPTGANEVIHTLALDGQPKHLLIAINDNFADGRDISWLWDADFEELLGMSPLVDVAGTRSADMALRLKYAGWTGERIHRHESLGAAVDASLARLEPGETLFVLPTYTAMLDVRRLLARRGHLMDYLA